MARGAVSWRGKSTGDVLKMEVDDAAPFFASMPNISHALQLLKDVGLQRRRFKRPLQDGARAKTGPKSAAYLWVLTSLRGLLLVTA
jgi:hypothetical protein